MSTLEPLINFFELSSISDAHGGLNIQFLVLIPANVCLWAYWTGTVKVESYPLT
jgi:hypothetical protein